MKAAAVILTLFLAACGGDADPPPSWAESGLDIEDGAPRGGLDLTFLVAADTHFGATGKVPVRDRPGEVEWIPIEGLLTLQVNELASVSGMELPPPIGGRVAEPRGLLIAGDLTESGLPEEWEEFQAWYPHDAGGGRTPWPVYPCPGNHDLYGGDFVSDQIEEIHGGVHYSFDWDDIPVVCLGEAPNYRALRWLMKDLAEVGRRRPVILFFHYPLAGPMSGSNWFGEGDYRDHLARILEGFRVVAIFHGHYHASGHYLWSGIDVYNVGSAKHSMKDFFVVRLTDRELTVASRQYYPTSRWWWFHKKPVDGSDRAEIRKVYPAGGGPAPLIPYPVDAKHPWSRRRATGTR